MVTRTDYSSAAVAAARSVLIELVHLLGEYRDSIVIVGGWVPELLLKGAERPHTGSMDIDVALDHRRLQEEGYKSIRDLLVRRGYKQGTQPFIYLRDVETGGGIVRVQVDFLAGEYEGSGRSHRHQRTQGIQARKARGCDLAFEGPKEVGVDGEQPGGATDSVNVRVASIVPFIAMKGIVLADRLKEKDAWDIYYCVLHYPGGVEALVEEFRPYLSHGLVREGLSRIAGAFASVGHTGPMAVVTFEEVTDPDERARLQRDAFERIHALLWRLGIASSDPSARNS